MRIISNYKDYYDWLVSKYGIDNNIVYNRVCEKLEDKKWVKGGIFEPEHITNRDSVSREEIHFCGNIVIFHYIFGDVFYNEQILNANPTHYPKELNNFYLYSKWLSSKNVKDIINSWKLHYDKKKERWQSKYSASPVVLNAEYDCPVVIKEIKNPRLSDYSFAKFMSPDDAFVAISNWLSKEKVITDNQTDKEKIISHGFDTKTSFRKM